MIGLIPTLFVVFSLGLMGNYLHLLGLLHLLKPYLTLPLFFAYLFSLAYLFGYRIKHQTYQLKKPEIILLFLLTVQFLISALGLFVPETSFDALWYHLPEAQVYAATGSIHPIPELLYSTMPRLGEMLFVPGFMLHSPFLVKLVSFIQSILFITLSFHFARLFLPRFWSLFTAIAINSIFIVSWQSTAGYVDLTRALFELASLLILTKSFTLTRSTSSSYSSSHYYPSPFAKGRLGGVVLAGIFMGLALSVKIQALFTLFATIIFITCHFLCHSDPPTGGEESSEATKTMIKQSLRRIILATSFYLLSAGIIAAPWYLYNWYHSGHTLFPLNLPDKQLDQLTHAGAASISDWLTHQFTNLPLIPWDLSLNYTRLLTPIILLLLPLALLDYRVLIKKHFPYLLTTSCYLLIWWFLPPPENRYALGIAPVILTLLIYALYQLPQPLSRIKQIAFTSALVIILINLSVRFIVTYRNLPVILGLQSRQDYLNSHTTDFNRSIMDTYYSGYWQTYRY